MRSKNKFYGLGVFALLSAFLILTNLCSNEPQGRGGRQGAQSEVVEAAIKTYVAPGDLDEYYLFYSGGHSGNVYVAGVPSMRHISTIPVFTPYPATGYGFDDESKAMLGEFTWGDVHHPANSETNGEYDGRWLFVNDNANNRVARIDLRDFKTKQILGPIPNLSGNHGSTFITPNTEYITFASRFSIPIPKGTVAPVEEYATKYKGIVAAVSVDPNTGEMKLAWQIMMPPFNYDLGDGGKGLSDGWMFWSCYNTERAIGNLEITASQKDRDYVACVNWKEAEKAITAGKFKMVDGAKVIDPAQAKGVVYFVECAKSPHGVDVSPDGRYFIGSGKLSPTCTVFDIEKLQAAIAANDFTGEEDGIPVVNYESVRVAEIDVGLGPLHTQFDNEGFAYTSLFVESAVAKWKLGTWEVLDKVPVEYQIGHLCTAEGDTRSPDGKYLVALNKLSKGTHLNVGPSQPESSQLIDLTGEKMRVLYTAFTEPEPHYAQMIKADKLNPIEVYPKEENTNPNAIWEEDEASVTRSGRTVTVKMVAVRTHFAPTKIEARVGDKVIIHLTNIEQITDELHGLAINEYNINIIADPGEVKSVEFNANKKGVFPFYCTNFCSALHQEMQGYLIVR